MVEVYYNSGQFAYSIQFLEHFYTSPMKLYQDISDYYECSKKAMLAHNRIKRYEILLDFFKEVVLESDTEEDISLTQVFQEILLLDLYLREDLKSRPVFSFAKPSTAELRALYDQYKLNHKMVHIEKFMFDIFQSATSGKAIRKDTIVLFDYANRDVLSKAANILILENELEK
jgi:hypothetical protein